MYGEAVFYYYVFTIIFFVVLLFCIFALLYAVIEKEIIYNSLERTQRADMSKKIACIFSIGIMVVFTGIGVFFGVPKLLDLPNQLSGNYKVMNGIVEEEIGGRKEGKVSQGKLIIRDMSDNKTKEMSDVFLPNLEVGDQVVVSYLPYCKSGTLFEVNGEEITKYEEKGLIRMAEKIIVLLFVGVAILFSWKYISLQKKEKKVNETDYSLPLKHGLNKLGRILFQYIQLAMLALLIIASFNVTNMVLQIAWGICLFIFFTGYAIRVLATLFAVHVQKESFVYRRFGKVEKHAVTDVKKVILHEDEIILITNNQRPLVVPRKRKKVEQLFVHQLEKAGAMVEGIQ